MIRKHWLDSPTARAVAKVDVSHKLNPNAVPWINGKFYPASFIQRYTCARMQLWDISPDAYRRKRKGSRAIHWSVDPFYHLTRDSFKPKRAVCNYTLDDLLGDLS